MPPDPSKPDPDGAPPTRRPQHGLKIAVLLVVVVAGALVGSLLWDIRQNKYDDVETLNLSDQSITDAELRERIAGLRNLEKLHLSGTKITDDGLQHLRRCPKLYWVTLDRTAVTDAGLAHLNSLEALRWLSLSDTQVTGTRFKHLADLPNSKAST